MFRKHVIDLKSENFKKREREGKKGKNTPELQNPNIEAEVYNNNKKCDWEKKALKLN